METPNESIDWTSLQPCSFRFHHTPSQSIASHKVVLTVMTRASKGWTFVLTIFLLVFARNLDAGILWSCTINGTIVSEPALIDDEWHMRFRGVSYDAQRNDFCKDWLEREEVITLTQQYYSKLGQPKRGDAVSLKEYKEENDYGQGLMQWRYFDFGFRE